MNLNAKIIDDFIKKGSEKVLLVNSINDEINLFYFFFINHFVSKNYKIKIISTTKEISEKSDDLFIKQYLYISFKKISFDIVSKAVIFVPYSEIKKNKNFLKINSYNLDKDVRYLINQYKLDENNKDNLLNNIKLNPHMVNSELEKALINKNYYNDKLNKEDKDNILNLRLNIFQSKKNLSDIKSIYDLIKKEVDMKKFNFLTYWLENYIVQYFHKIF